MAFGIEWGRVARRTGGPLKGAGGGMMAGLRLVLGGGGLAPTLRLLLGIVTAAIFLETPSIARAGCGEEDIQSELDEPKALTKAGLRTEFRDFVLREFPVGSDGERLLRWLERSGFSTPEISYYGKLSMSGEEAVREEALADERERKGTPLQLSIRSFSGLCGQNLYAVYWRLGSCNRIVEIFIDQERCRLDLP